ncbi:hypothetical protein UB46_27740 [Burkholderiaceae bacterium 16]|nr:hypothetical protein UB46_27740 [Burkholderiaceae bacterium 16]
MPVLTPRNTASPDAQDCHLFSHLEARARCDHDKCAIAFQGQRISYGELHRASLCLAGYLQQHLEVRRGDRILLAMQDGPHFAIAWYAVLRCDAVVVAVNPATAPAAMARSASDTGARVAIATQECQAVSAAMLGAGGLRGCIFAACPEPAGHAGGHDFSGALAAGIGPVPMVAGGPDPAVMAYLPDSPGQPRAATLSHRAFAQMAVNATAVPLREMARMTLLHQAVSRGDAITLSPASQP